jgi:hypothetical protein
MIRGIPIDRRQGDRSAAIVQRYGRRNRRALCNGDGHGQPEAGLNGGHGITRGRGTIAGKGGGDIPSRGPLRLKAKRPIRWRFAVFVQLAGFPLPRPGRESGQSFDRCRWRLADQSGGGL